MSEMHIEDYTDSIYKEIINGDLEVSKEKMHVFSCYDLDIRKPSKERLLRNTSKKVSQSSSTRKVLALT
jgi:hypothetical protein